MYNEDDLMDESSPGDRGIWNRNRIGSSGTYPFDRRDVKHRSPTSPNADLWTVVGDIHGRNL